MEVLAHLTANLIIYTALVLSLNFAMGKTSIWSVGHLGFFGAGALASAWVLSLGVPLPFWAGFLSASVCGAALGLAVGMTTIKLRQDYFVILSLALSELILSLSLSWKGPAGFDRLERPDLFGFSMEKDWHFILAVLLPFLALLFWLFNRFSTSPLERACALIRTNEELAIVLKLSPRYYKLWCFTLSTTVAGACGALATFYAGSTDPNKISLENNLLLFAVVLFGGLNSIQGAVLGGLLLVALPVILEALILRGPFGSLYASQIRQLLFGILLILVIRFLPRGLAGSVSLLEHRGK